MRGWGEWEGQKWNGREWEEQIWDEMGRVDRGGGGIESRWTSGVRER